MEIVKPEHNFYQAAKSFCRQIDDVRIYNKNNIDKLLKVLVHLYSAALNLPKYQSQDSQKRLSLEQLHTFLSSVPCSQDDPLCQQHKQNIHFEHGNAYHEFFCPYDAESAVTGSLEDDLADILKDIERGICLYEHGYIEDAVYQWRLLFADHWGEHITGAIRALDSTYRHMMGHQWRGEI